MATDTNTTDAPIEAVDKEEMASTSEPTRPGRVFVPPVDIYETPAGITVLADVPGATNDSIEIDLDNRTLTLSADVPEVGLGDETDVATEWASGRYHRQFTLPQRIDQSGIEASLNAGVLKVWLPRSEAAKPRKITVAAG